MKIKLINFHNFVTLSKNLVTAYIYFKHEIEYQCFNNVNLYSHIIISPKIINITQYKNIIL